MDDNTRQEPTLVLGGPGKTWANQVERKTVSSAPESRTAHARDAAATGTWNATATRAA